MKTTPPRAWKRERRNALRRRPKQGLANPRLKDVTVAILAQGTHWAVATSQAFLGNPSSFLIIHERAKRKIKITSEHNLMRVKMRERIDCQKMPEEMIEDYSLLDVRASERVH